jgi:hypothetical protein
MILGMGREGGKLKIIATSVRKRMRKATGRCYY